jgi:diacylglycerol diphosphate phosphatase/phosphatidate phosphatase
MNFLKRYQHNGTTEAEARPKQHHEKRVKRGPIIMNMSQKPTFGQWLKVTWLDILTMAIMGIIGLGVSSVLLYIHTFSLTRA